MKKQWIVEKYKEWRDSLKTKWLFKRFDIKQYIKIKLGYKVNKKNNKMKNGVKEIKENIQINFKNEELELLNKQNNEKKIKNKLIKFWDKIVRFILRNLLKIIRLIKNIMIAEKYFYVRIIIFLVIIIYTFSMKYIYRYIISMLILVWIILYKYLYIYFLKTENQFRYEQFFINNRWLNVIIRLPLFLILSRYYWLKIIQRVWILISKILRYIFLKLRIIKYYKYIDKCMYYIIFIYLRVLVEKSYNITNKIKKKITTKSIKEIIDWRLIILIINIILIQKILIILGISWNQFLIIVFIIINLYVIDAMMVYIYWYNRYIVEALYLVHYGLIVGKIPFQYEKYFLIHSNMYVIYRISLFYYNITIPYKVPYRHNELIYYDWLNAGKFRGYYYFEKYWLNENLYYEDIIWGINITKLNQFFYYFNYMLELKSYMNYMDMILKIDIENIKNIENLEENNIEIYDHSYEYEIDFEKEKEKILKNHEYIKEINWDNIGLKRRVLPKDEILLMYNRLNNVKEDIQKMNEMVELLYWCCHEYLFFLNRMLEENGQEISVITNVLLEKDSSVVNLDPDRWDANHQLKYNEIIYNNYEINNNNYKLKLTKNNFFFRVKLGEKLEEIKELKKKFDEYVRFLKKNTPKNILSLPGKFDVGFHFNLQSSRVSSKRRVKLADNDDDTTLVYSIIKLKNYKTYYMEERIRYLKEMIENKEITLGKKLDKFEKIKIEENDIRKYKVREGGMIVEYISYEENMAQQERIKIIRENIGVVGEILGKAKNKKLK